jgi:hypothetical protein
MRTRARRLVAWLQGAGSVGLVLLCTAAGALVVNLEARRKRDIGWTALLAEGGVALVVALVVMLREELQQVEGEPDVVERARAAKRRALKKRCLRGFAHGLGWRPAVEGTVDAVSWGLDLLRGLEAA